MGTTALPRPMHVVVTDRKFPDRADPFGDVVESNGGDLTYADCENEEDVIDSCANADVIITSKAPLTTRVFESIGPTRHVIRIGTGFDTINVKAATDHGVPVSNTPGYSTHEIAEHAVTLLLGAAREVVYADRDMRASNDFGDRVEVKVLRGGTVGIVGFGRIGRAVVPKARGLGMEVIATDPYVSFDVFEALGVEKVTFDALLSRADAVTIHAPLTAETHHLLGEAEFEAMKDDAVLANTARGPIVDEAALVAALEAGELWAAGLDVFEIEPPVDSPALDCDRIICSPHHGGNAPEVQTRCLDIARAELRRVMTGEHAEHIVNPEALQYSDSLLNPERTFWE